MNIKIRPDFYYAKIGECGQRWHIFYYKTIKNSICGYGPPYKDSICTAPRNKLFICTKCLSAYISIMRLL